MFAADIPPRTAWLTSARYLQRIGYAPVTGGRVSIVYEPDEGGETLVSSLVAGFRQVLEWADDPMLEIRFGSIDQEGEAAVPDGN